VLYSEKKDFYILEEKDSSSKNCSDNSIQLDVGDEKVFDTVDLVQDTFVINIKSLNQNIKSKDCSLQKRVQNESILGGSAYKDKKLLGDRKS